MLKNAGKHFLVIIHHKWEVLKLSVKAGIPIRGMLHDLSKFSPTEFIQSAKYYAGGVKSPISLEKLEVGYSKAWLHHKGRNKHHAEYWYDAGSKENMPIIPFKYVCEMICDQLGAGKVYQGKKWNQQYQLSYWLRQRVNIPLNDALKGMLDEVYFQVSEKGIGETITKKNLEKWYNQYTKQEVEMSSRKN